VVAGSNPAGRAKVVMYDAVVVVAQLVESRIVIPAVAGSSPVGHPIFKALLQKLFDLVFATS
jgi:hypothetical protein